jgi:hypothetical protein
LSDEGDNPGLTDRVGPPVSEKEATTKLDKRSRRRPKRTRGRIGQAVESDKRRSWAAAGLENKGGGQAEIKEKNSEIKIRFLNLPRLWKFVEEDLGGFLT